MSFRICARAVALLAGFAAFTLSASPTRAAETIIEFFNRSFLPEAVTIDLGDTVIWNRIFGEHRLRSGKPDGEAGTLDEPGALFDVVLDESNESFSFTFDEFREEGYFFFDENNPVQLGFIDFSTGEIQFRVAVVDNVFRPEVAEIFAGDTIFWDHEMDEGFHTVTSGRSSRPEDNPGALFDVDMDDPEDTPGAISDFFYQFDDPGDFPYFCRPHEAMGMVGTIVVQRPFIRGDANFDASVDVSDPVFVLGFLFIGNEMPTCEDALDINDSGAVDISDATYGLNFLFTGGPRIPPPYPRAGGDRTDDELRCF